MPARLGAVAGRGGWLRGGGGVCEGSFAWRCECIGVAGEGRQTFLCHAQRQNGSYRMLYIWPCSDAAVIASKTFLTNLPEEF